MNEPADTSSELPFTGERFTPDCVREIAYEHWHRYAFAQRIAQDKCVLDAACGEGYGSALLATMAKRVTAVDIDASTIAHASLRYGSHQNLEFMQCDVTALDTLPASSFDLIVSFETLEHVAEQARLLDGFARLLSDDGVLLISTPDKHNYNAGCEPNPFHVRELQRDEFEALLAARFPAHRLYAQKLLFQSTLWSLDATVADVQPLLRDGETLREGFYYPPQYYLAGCARDPGVLDSLPSLSLYGDASESVYAHYNAEVRKSIAAGMRIAELEAELAVLRRMATPDTAK